MQQSPGAPCSHLEVPLRPGNPFPTLPLPFPFPSSSLTLLSLYAPVPPGAAPVALFAPGALQPGWAYRLAPLATTLALRLATPDECAAAGLGGAGVNATAAGPRFAAPATLDGAAAGEVLVGAAPALGGGPIV